MTIHANARGNTADRRRRRQWLLTHFGNGITAPCWQCGKRVNSKTLVVDRIRPGGSYRRSNIRPHCPPCSTRQGYALGAGRAHSSMRVRFSHSSHVRPGRVSQPIGREMLKGLLIGLVIVLTFAMAAFHPTYGVPLLVGLLIGGVMDMRKRGGQVTDK